MQHYLVSLEIPQHRAVSIAFMHMDGFIGLTVTHNMNRIASFTFFQVMIAREHVPVMPLVRHDHPRAFAKGTQTVKGSDYRGSNELGPVGNPFHGFSQ
jgi:hypothetical protein